MTRLTISRPVTPEINKLMLLHAFRDVFFPLINKKHHVFPLKVQKNRLVIVRVTITTRQHTQRVINVTFEQQLLHNSYKEVILGLCVVCTKLMSRIHHSVEVQECLAV